MYAGHIMHNHLSHANLQVELMCRTGIDTTTTTWSATTSSFSTSKALDPKIDCVVTTGGDKLWHAPAQVSLAVSCMVFLVHHVWCCRYDLCCWFVGLYAKALVGYMSSSIFVKLVGLLINQYVFLRMMHSCVREQARPDGTQLCTSGLSAGNWQIA